MEADNLIGYAKMNNSVTADYQSVIGFGKCELCEKDEAIKGLQLLLNHCKMEGFSAEKCVELGITAVYKIKLDSVTGKSRFPL